MIEILKRIFLELLAIAILYMLFVFFQLTRLGTDLAEYSSGSSIFEGAPILLVGGIWLLLRGFLFSKPALKKWGYWSIGIVVLSSIVFSVYNAKSNNRQSTNYPNREADSAYTSKYINPSVKTNRNVFSLRITTVPADARVQIMNIKPKYYDGIKLKKGRYDVKISKKGYGIKRGWIKLEKDEIFTAKLQKKHTSIYQSSSNSNPINNSFRRPNLSHLSYDEKTSIEMACIVEKTKGPARYNKCLQGKLNELGY